MLSNHLSDGLMSRMCISNSYSGAAETQTAEKWAEALTSGFPRKSSVQAASRPRRRCPAPLITGDMRGPAGTAPPTSPIGAVRKAGAVDLARTWREGDKTGTAGGSVTRGSHRGRRCGGAADESGTADGSGVPAAVLPRSGTRAPCSRQRHSRGPSVEAARVSVGRGRRKETHTHWGIAEPKRPRTSCHLWPDDRAWRPLRCVT